MKIQDIEQRLAATLVWAWNDGCPVACSSADKCKEMAAITRRRWFSFERRHPNMPEGSREDRIEDLARGLAEKFERGGLKMAGPLISDYRWLAEQLANVLLGGYEQTG